MFRLIASPAFALALFAAAAAAVSPDALAGVTAALGLFGDVFAALGL